MAASLELRSAPVRTLAFGSIAGAYTLIESSLTHPIRIFYLQNLTDAALMFSFDGVNDHFPLLQNGFLLLDVTANQLEERGFYISNGSRVSVKRIGIPTTGAVYLTAMYARGS